MMKKVDKIGLFCDTALEARLNILLTHAFPILQWMYLHWFIDTFWKPMLVLPEQNEMRESNVLMCFYHCIINKNNFVNFLV